MRIPAGSTVAMFDSEYSSVIRCWQMHAGRQGSAVKVIPMALPARRDDILKAVGTLDGGVHVFVCSAVTSTAAIAMPVREISDICQAKGVRLIVDAAHMVGHMDSLLAGARPDAVFGSLHKWLPVPRPSGFLWARDGLLGSIKPATVSLTWDATSPVERFSWWGTWDPAACLTVPSGLDAIGAWVGTGHVAAAEDLAVGLSGELAGLGLIPSVEPSLAASRLRAFLVPGTAPETLKAAALSGGVRAWVGTSPANGCVLRVSTNVYNGTEDASRLCRAVARAVRGQS
jgi:isopenicillin-N epimerase